LAAGVFGVQAAITRDVERAQLRKKSAGGAGQIPAGVEPENIFGRPASGFGDKQKSFVASALGDESGREAGM
jgi:hypothetical protein